MTYKEGSKCIGSHGTILTRDDQGYWFTESGFNLCSDETIDWLLGLNVEYPKPPKRGPGKISKTEPDPPPIFQYKWRLK